MDEVKLENRIFGKFSVIYFKFVLQFLLHLPVVHNGFNKSKKNTVISKGPFWPLKWGQNFDPETAPF